MRRLEITKSPSKEKKQRCAATVECSRSPDEKERACLQKGKLKGTRRGPLKMMFL
jgi:hypothetical protein